MTGCKRSKKNGLVPIDLKIHPTSGNGTFIHFEGTLGREGRDARHVNQECRKTKDDQRYEEGLTEAYSRGLHFFSPVVKCSSKNAYALSSRPA